MLIYNETIFTFIRKAKSLLRDIIRTDTDIKVNKSRFQLNDYLYPIDIVVFEGSQKIAYFDHESYQIGLNESLSYCARDHVLKDILRHEFAHYITYLKHGYTSKAHGDEFKNTCLQYSWDNSISKASMVLEDYKVDKVANLENEKVLNKVKKLLTLASSQNESESELATLKANQLLLKHNLKYTQLSDKNETLYVKELMFSKRRNSKMTCIYDILKHFYVSPVLRYKKSGVYLEICGSALNVELTEYVYNFLSYELERLWESFKIQNTHLKGIKVKNSFFLGIARGYKAKIDKSHKELSLENKRSLILIENKLSQMTSQIYNRLSSSSSSASLDTNALSKGISAGKNLNINKAVKSNKTPKLLAGFNL